MKFILSLLLMLSSLGVALGGDKTPFENIEEAYLETELDGAATNIFADSSDIDARCFSEYLSIYYCLDALSTYDCVFWGTSGCSVYVDPAGETSCTWYGSANCEPYLRCCGENYSCRGEYEGFLRCVREKIFGCNGDVCAPNGGRIESIITPCFSATATVDVLGKGNVEMQDLSLVSKIGTVEKPGIYAPQTPGGRLLVSGALASAYPALQDTHAEELTLMGIATGLSHHDITHMGAAVPRVLCGGISSTFCTQYNANGMAYIFGIGYDYLMWATDSAKPVFVRLLLMAATVPIVLLCVTLEMTVGASMGPMVLLLAAFTGYYYCFYTKRGLSTVVKPIMNGEKKKD
ncbi:expressed unknown protein [Seminavis robusta]|uniref:Uncharacterized protein n=1 Tax=Seminavis robusta TaxID=568900 RepID=A0A9N8DG74_9STRA|nr:expressed unknown protein [Seminavis robusta]|eukprot:Sro110_g054840.1 n/a (347) ;mRNA; f:38521-39904